MQYLSSSKKKHRIKFVFDGEEFCKFFLTKMLPSVPGQGPKPIPVAQQQNEIEFCEAEQNLCS